METEQSYHLALEETLREERAGNLSVCSRMTRLQVDDRQWTLGTVDPQILFGSRGLADLDSDVLAQGKIKCAAMSSPLPCLCQVAAILRRSVDPCGRIIVLCLLGLSITPGLEERPILQKGKQRCRHNNLSKVNQLVRGIYTMTNH